MPTVIDGKGKSSQHSRSIQINAVGLIDISITTPALLEDQNDHVKKRLMNQYQM
jgi:hypothetical protein